MVISYPLGTGSKLKNFELKMSLRSIEKHLANVDQVIIVGEKPDWIQNVEYIQFPDTTNIPDQNIMLKTMEALKRVDKVLHVHDDHYFLSDFDADNFPYFYEDTLQSYLQRRGLDLYGRRARNSMHYLKSQDLPTKFFDIHTPIIYEKATFEKLFDLPWNHEGYVIKSLYANMLKIEGTEMKDVKHNHPPQGGKLFSSQSHLRASVQRFLLEQFPKKSIYEL